MILALCIRRKKKRRLKNLCRRVFRTAIRLKLEAGVWRGSTVLRRFMNTTYCGKRCGLSSATQMIVICIYISAISVKTLLVLEYSS